MASTIARGEYFKMLSKLNNKTAIKIRWNFNTGFKFNSSTQTINNNQLPQKSKYKGWIINLFKEIKTLKVISVLMLIKVKFKKYNFK